MEPRSGMYLVTAEAPIGTREKTAVKGETEAYHPASNLFTARGRLLCRSKDHKVA